MTEMTTATATDILTIEVGELGAREAADGTTKYGTWLDQQAGTHVYSDADWCGSSQLWCIARGGPTWIAATGGTNKAFAYVQNWYNWFHANGRISHTPWPRRLVWYNWAGTGPDANHVGLVASVNGKSMKVFEGNHNNRFELVDRAIDSQVMGFGEWWSHVAVPPGSGDDCWIGTV